MKSFKSHFKFNKQEQRGVFFLLLLVIVLQAAYFIIKVVPFGRNVTKVTGGPDIQARVDSLKELRLGEDSIKINPFNPNFITDHKGYALGMSPIEIDRLLRFRAGNKYVNSTVEFQRVTLISDSLLQVISPYFRFPEWVRESDKPFSVGGNPILGSNGKQSSEGKGMILDINKATAEDLKSINGIGDKLSERIIKFRDRLGGFLVEEQLNDVYGLEKEVVQRTLEKFKVLSAPNVKKMNINTATADEMGGLIYIGPLMAQKIVDHRESVGAINSYDELKEIQGFPSEKIDRIKLYLQL